MADGASENPPSVQPQSPETAPTTPRQLLEDLKRDVGAQPIAPEKKPVLEQRVQALKQQRDALSQAEQEELASIEQEIQNVGGGAPTNPPAQPRVEDALRDVGLPPEVGEGVGRFGKMIERIGEMFSKLKNVLSSLLAPLMSVPLFRKLFKEHAPEILQPMAKVAEVHAAMESVLGKNIVQKDPTKDEEAVTTLEAIYNGLPSEGKPATFELFCQHKARELRQKSLKGPYTIADLLQRAQEPPLPPPLTAEQEREKKKQGAVAEEAQKKQALKERIEKDSKVSNAVHTFALAKAMRRATGTIDLAFALNPIGVERDLQGNRTDTYHYMRVAESIAKWLEEKKGRQSLGIEIDGGDLEEADGTNWVDYDIIPHFKANLMDNPTTAVKALLGLDVAATKMNKTAKTRLPDLQDLIRQELAVFTTMPETPPQVASTTPPTTLPAATPPAG